MFHVPLKLRAQTVPCSPRGPEFSKSQSVMFKIDGCEIAFRAPKHKAESHHTPINSIESYSTSRIQWKDLVGGKDKWRSFCPQYRVWDFYGPMFSGRCASVSFSVNIIRQLKPNNEISFFHPRVFESAISSILTDIHFSDLDREHQRQRWYSPVNWEPVENFPCCAVVFEVQPNKKYFSGNMEKNLYFPISNDLLACMNFNVSRPGVVQADDEKNDISIDEWVDINPMISLVDDVMNSVELKLSKESEMLRDQAIVDLDDRALTKVFPPINWLSGEVTTQYLPE